MVELKKQVRIFFVLLRHNKALEYKNIIQWQTHDCSE